MPWIQKKCQDSKRGQDALFWAYHEGFRWRRRDVQPCLRHFDPCRGWRSYRSLMMLRLQSGSDYEHAQRTSELVTLRRCVRQFGGLQGYFETESGARRGVRRSAASWVGQRATLFVCNWTRDTGAGGMDASCVLPQMCGYVMVLLPANRIAVIVTWSSTVIMSSNARQPKSKNTAKTLNEQGNHL